MNRHAALHGGCMVHGRWMVMPAARIVMTMTKRQRYKYWQEGYMDGAAQREHRRRGYCSEQLAASIPAS